MYIRAKAAKEEDFFLHGEIRLILKLVYFWYNKSIR